MLWALHTLFLWWKDPRPEDHRSQSSPLKKKQGRRLNDSQIEEFQSFQPSGQDVHGLSKPVNGAFRSALRRMRRICPSRVPVAAVRRGGSSTVRLRLITLLCKKLLSKRYSDPPPRGVPVLGGDGVTDG